MSNKRRETQTSKIRKHLEEGKAITPLEALTSYGCMRLADVIFRLKKTGLDIITNPIKDGDKTYASYTLDISKNN